MPKAKKPKFIIYDGQDEMILCTPATEKKMLKKYFEPRDSDRDLDLYDRHEYTDDELVLKSELKVW